MEAYLIFGMGPAGLFLARQLRHHNNRAIVAIGKKDDIGRYSNTLDKYYATEELVGIKEAVEQTIKEYDTVYPYVCSDQYLSFFFEKWPDIFNKLYFSSPDYETLRLFSDKDSLMSFCQKLNMTIPHSEYLANSYYNGMALAIKPLVKRGVSQMGKITVISSGEQLKAFKQRVVESGASLTDYIVQPFIKGNNLFEYGYGGVFENGKALVDMCFYQLRQYPQGVSCYTLEITDPVKVSAIHQAVDVFPRQTNYTGFLQFDIKEDETTGELYVLDVNPRPWGSVSMLSSKLSSNGQLWHVKERNKPCKWRFPLKELFSFKNRMNVPYSKIREMRSGNNYTYLIDLIDKKDLGPFLMQPVISIIKLFKR